MKRWRFLIIFCGGVFQSCGFLAEPQPFGELLVNIHFAGGSSQALSKENAVQSPQAIDRVVILVREFSEFVLNRSLEREIIRKEFRLGNDRQLRTVIQVPLQNAGVNYFNLQIQAFQGLVPLYSGQDFISFDEKVRRVTSNIVLEPVAFRLFGPATIPPSNNRVININGQAQDTSVTDIEIIADSVNVKFPISKGGGFANPVMLFGDNTLVRVVAYRGAENRGETSRRVTYTGRKSDILVALVWDQPVDLNLEILNPRGQVISAVARGDSIDGSLLLEDANGYGPEVYEWRANSILQRGQFVVSVSRPRATLGQLATGRVYVFLRERQNLPLRRIRRFAIQPQELQVEIFNDLIWPLQ
ncbi:MAG: hypothetical protein ONB46_18765 [candidate division KSB1 bacterium]|nr:hypothetical protein [candidate division KSB1 bacterium]MDZ7367924.1 hypothetical protein [candidate division KSB1 bacterium]MDZ7406509.1 hypothetical protein [candidate division KSB1 bacterium]